MERHTNTRTPSAAPEHFLQRVKLFSALSVAECEHVEERLKQREFPPQQVIVREGGPGDSMFFIISGQVEVRRRDLVSGIDFLLTALGPGENFGEMSLLTGKLRSASVQAVQPTVCAVLDQTDFRALLIQYPLIGLLLTAVLAERIDQTSQQVGVDFVNLTKILVDPLVLKLLPRAMMMAYTVVPVAFCNNRLTLAMTNPNNVLAFDDIRRVIKGVMIEPVAVTEDDFKKFMASTYPKAIDKAGTAPTHSGDLKKLATTLATVSHAATIDLLQSEIIRDLQMADDTVAETETKQDLMNVSEDAPIVRLGNSILGLAVQERSSDIHIEPMEHDVTVRFRIDGVLQVVQKLPKKVQLGLISRLKILSRLDISEKRLPQDGRISVTMDGKPIDFRVSTVPGKWGEKVCMRILDKSNTLLGLEKTISHRPTLELVRTLISEPHGILYVTGPTGSGKTTTLYSALAEINDPGVNISTAEDPIEYDLAGVTQIQVNRETGLDFAKILRAFLRQDPDILLVGETRDRETAQIAVEAALTGHMVFTTLHTNSAAGAFARLKEMGVESFLVSSSTIGVIAQRLARRLCETCKEPYEADQATCEYLGLEAGSTLYKARGCSVCSGKGLKGRIGVYEVLQMNVELRSLVAAAARSDDIHAAALRNGMLDLKRYAGLLLLEGLTSTEEVMQVVSMHE